jgi:diaminopimelate epimerase
MAIPFVKLHGCGNDYVYVDGFAHALPADPAALAVAISDRHRGVGGDGLIALLPPTAAGAAAGAQARMRIWNADGSESEMCGNGIRCLARLAREHGRVRGEAVAIETGAGLKHCRYVATPDQCPWRVAVDMGAPLLTPAAVPVLHPGAGPRLELELPLADGGQARFLAVGMGNPHAVTFVADAEAVDLARLGPPLERHVAFPRRSNIEFVSALPPVAGLPALRQRTWERGSGITQACGTGACAVAVAAILDGRVPAGAVLVRLDGGDLEIHWDGQGPVTMTGEAVRVFDGRWSA